MPAVVNGSQIGTSELRLLASEFSPRWLKTGACVSSSERPLCFAKFQTCQKRLNRRLEAQLGKGISLA
ncbi:hypothetical protein C2E31_11025 [Rhodopirellula baltica]|nr:hypothetical protein C2E31_11025 [Rhodopirellula baltica]